MICPTNGQISEAPKIFEKSHEAVITIVSDMGSGTGFSIDPQTYIYRGKKVRYVITALHVVKGAENISVYLYTDKKDKHGDWETRLCDATIDRLDATRDVAILALSCDICNRTGLGSLETRLSPARTGETIFVIGDAISRNRHTLIFGILSVVNYDFPLIKSNYDVSSMPRVPTAKVHGLTGAVSFGDSGSPVMDKTGKVVAMVSALKVQDAYAIMEPFINGRQVHCVTVEEISTVFNTIFEGISLEFVGCTADMSAFLGKQCLYHSNAGRSYLEMTAFATAMNAQYFAVSHEESTALACVFYGLCGKYLQNTKIL